MSEQPPTPPPPEPANPNPTAPVRKPTLDLGPGVGIGVQQDMAAPERKLPPVKILLYAIAALALVVGVGAYLMRAKPQGGGTVDQVTAVDVPGQNSVLVAMTVTFKNVGEKPFWVHNVKGKLKTAAQEYEDDAASAVDFERYFEAFPALKANTQQPLLPETKILPGATARGTIIVSFPVTLDAFNQRQSISAVIQPYDQPLPVTLTK